MTDALKEQIMISGTPETADGSAKADKPRPETTEAEKNFGMAPVPKGLLMSWVSHPARTEPLKALFALGVAAGMAVLVYMWVGTWLAFLSFLIIIGSVHGFLFPVWYRLYDECLVEQTLFGSRLRNWSTLRRADAGRFGVHLSPFIERSRLDGTRGIYIRFSNNRQEVLDTVNRLIENARNEEINASKKSGNEEYAVKKSDADNKKDPQESIEDEGLIGKSGSLLKQSENTGNRRKKG